MSGYVSRYLIVLVGLCGCGPSSPRSRPLLREVTAEVGLDATPVEWPPGRYQIPEISAGGIALLDHDGDGDLDIYQIRHPAPDHPRGPAPNRLYRQENGGRFTPVPGAAGLDDDGYGSGVAVGDIDGDGDPDVYVTNVGADVLYLSDGDGTFANRTAAAGIRGDAWSTAASFLDHDRDGDLDLYVCHYLVDDPSRVCRLSLEEARDYCGPARYQGVADTLYRNNGDGTFSDVTAAAGIKQARPGFGVVCLDLTGDGWVDIYVANDKQPNQLHVNQGNGTFVDEAMQRGVALNGAGNAEASMGVAVGDVNSDGVLDLFMTHLVDETNTLYLGSKGANTFFDKSASSGLGGPSVQFTGWGCGFVDLEHDGDLDVVTVNGRVARGPVHPDADAGSFWNDYAEPNQVFLNDGAGQFKVASHLGGSFTSRVEASRSLAFGDLDRDGDVDLVASDVAGSLRVFLNDAPPTEHHWLGIRAVTGRRDALGALVTIEAGGQRQVRPIISSLSFACANEPVARFGLGTAGTVDRIEVLWPDGKIERFAPPGVDGLVTLRQGEGTR